MKKRSVMLHCIVAPIVTLAALAEAAPVHYTSALGTPLLSSMQIVNCASGFTPFCIPSVSNTIDILTSVPVNMAHLTSGLDIQILDVDPVAPTGELKKRNENPLDGGSDIAPQEEIKVEVPQVQDSAAEVVPDVPGTPADLLTADSEFIPRPSKLAGFVEGFKNFFRAIRDWFKTSNKTAFFRELGKKFATWFRSIKAKFTGKKAPATVTDTLSMMPTGGTATPASAALSGVELASIGKSWQDMEEKTVENIEAASDHGDAEVLLDSLDHTIEGLFEDEDFGHGLPILLQQEKEKEKAGTLITDPDAGPPRGNMLLFGKKHEQQLQNLESHWNAGNLKMIMAPYYKDGTRPNPDEITPVEGVFIEQCVDPVGICMADKRNYQILFEWFKDKNRPHDITHPNHKALYGNDAQNAEAEEIYRKQQTNPVPIPYLREYNKELGFEDKLSWAFNYGLTSNDPNRPRWWWNQLGLFDREKEVEQWIENNIPKNWLNSHFPLPVGPEIQHHFEHNIPAETKASYIEDLNELTKEAATKHNYLMAQKVHGDAMQDAAWNAVRKGKSQRAATDAIPEPETLVANPEMLKKLRDKTYKKEEKLWTLKALQKLNNMDEDKRLGRLREQGVHVIDVKNPYDKQWGT